VRLVILRVALLRFHSIFFCNFHVKTLKKTLKKLKYPTLPRKNLTLISSQWPYVENLLASCLFGEFLPSARHKTYSKLNFLHSKTLHYLVSIFEKFSSELSFENVYHLFATGPETYSFRLVHWHTWHTHTHSHTHTHTHTHTDYLLIAASPGTQSYFLPSLVCTSSKIATDWAVCWSML